MKYKIRPYLTLYYECSETTFDGQNGYSERPGVQEALELYKTSWPIKDRILSEKEVRQIIGGVSRTTLWEMQNRGEFPVRIRISSRRVGWRESQIREWLESREPASEAV
ncbi:MAG: AlpA family phage regulatory protein [Gammaproteobacteria bacterium]|nr:AlpA family phage regulatory protein [Gammaproteobacteria bacterium]